MRKTLFLKAAWLLVLPVLAVAGCDKTDTSTSPTADPNASTVTIQVYAGPLDPGGNAQYIVSLTSDSTVQVTLAGEQLANPLRTISVPLQIDISSWDGSICTPLDSNVTAPRLTAQLQRFLTAGSYCVKLSDPGNLSETTGAIVRIAYPAPKMLTGTSSPVNFSSTVLPGGVASRTLVASTAGTVAITLKSLGIGNVPVGVGIGVYGTDVTTSCTLTKIVNVMPGASPQIVEQVDAGTYCAAVVDTGTLSRTTTFSMDISNP